MYMYCSVLKIFFYIICKYNITGKRQNITPLYTKQLEPNSFKYFLHVRIALGTCLDIFFAEEFIICNVFKIYYLL